MSQSLINTCSSPYCELAKCKCGRDINDIASELMERVKLFTPKTVEFTISFPIGTSVDTQKTSTTSYTYYETISSINEQDKINEYFTKLSDSPNSTLIMTAGDASVSATQPLIFTKVYSNGVGIDYMGGFSYSRADGSNYRLSLAIKDGVYKLRWYAPEEGSSVVKLIKNENGTTNTLNLKFIYYEKIPDEHVEYIYQ